MKNKSSKTIRHEISVDIDLENFPSFEDLGKEVLEKIEKAKRDILKQIFETKDHESRNQKSIAVKDRREKRYYTILGELVFVRRRVFDRKQNRFFYPLDEWIGLTEREKICPLLKQELVRLAVDTPYRFVAREIKHWTKVDLHKDTIWSVLQEIGHKRWLEKNSTRRFNRHEVLPKIDEIVGKETPSEILCIGMDATYVKRQEHKQRIKTKHDVKVAVLYTGKEKRGGDLKLKNRQTVIQARDEKLEQFLGRVVAHAVEHYGLNQNTTVLLFGDGDTWIRRFQDFIPQAHYRLDPWHVIEKIKRAFDLEKLPKSWVEKVYGDPESLLFEIQKCQESLRADSTTNHQLIAELVTYLKNNRVGLLPWKVSKELQNKYKSLFKWGSGHVESQIEIAVYDRHKQNRMSWSKRGLQNLSTLREDKLNGHQKPKFTCTKTPQSFKINLGSLGVIPIHPH